MNKKGFTLIELLAVIVVLGIIMTIVGVNVMNSRKKANINEAILLENSIEELGPNIYSYEYLSGDRGEGTFYTEYQNLPTVTMDQAEGKGQATQTNNSLIIKLSTLKDAGYLNSSSIENPAGGGDCLGFLRVYKTTEGPYFEGNLCCSRLYSTNMYKRNPDNPAPKDNVDGANCAWYNKTESSSAGKIIDSLSNNFN